MDVISGSPAVILFLHTVVDQGVRNTKYSINVLLSAE